MPSNRIGRINEEIQRELAALIRTVKDPRVHGLVSVTAVDTTPDLRYAKIYVSVLDKSDVKEVVKGLKSAGGYLRRELGPVEGFDIGLGDRKRRLEPLRHGFGRFGALPAGNLEPLGDVTFDAGHEVAQRLVAARAHL